MQPHSGAAASGSRPSAAAAAAAENGVIEIHSLDEWRSKWQAQSSSNKLMVVHFSAKWCGPCRFIEPAFAELAAQFRNVEFVTIDVDELEVLQVEVTGHLQLTYKDKDRRSEDRMVG